MSILNDVQSTYHIITDLHQKFSQYSLIDRNDNARPIKIENYTMNHRGFHLL